MQTAKSPWFPSVSGLRWACEDVKKPRNDCASDREEENGVQNLPQPFDDRACSQKKEYDGRFDEGQYWDVDKVESHQDLCAIR
jgi:hypothetical protein